KYDLSRHNLSTSMPRIRFDPENEVPPDFESEDYADVRAAFPVPANVVVALLTGWTSQHDKRKIAWALQVDEDRLAKKRPNDSSENCQRGTKRGRRRGGASTGRGSKEEATGPSVRCLSSPTRPHTFAPVALCAQQDFQMPELWYFTPEARREAAEFHHAIAEEAFGLSQTEEGLALKPLASFRPSKKVIPDHFSPRRSPVFSKKWQQRVGRRNVEAYSGFYWLLETHDLQSETWGTQVLLLYHARIRRSWHDAITAKKDIFNISIMSEQVLQHATDDVMNSMRLDSVSK
ncbi:hypothetical protein A0H81_12751, partial [Grifola frondosa]